MAVTIIERSYARAAVYRLLSLLFSYPSEDACQELPRALDAALVAATLMPSPVARAAAETARAVRSREQAELAREHTSLFTYSASPDCPLNECAYSAKHVYQEVQQMADIAGFFRAFGMEIRGQRPDDLSAQLEFCYLLAMKEGHARERRMRRQVAICRDAQRAFVHDHLGRWADNIGRRLQALAPESAYAAFGGLLASFVAEEIEYLKAGPVVPHEETPTPPEPPDDGECPEVPGTSDIDEEDIIGALTPVEEPVSGNGG